MELPQEMAKSSNATDNQSGHVHSLFTVSVLQKSLHVGQNRGSGLSSARNLQEQSKTRDLPKDKDKEGTGNRLLNVSGGPSGGASPLPDHLEGPGSPKVPVHAEGRDGDLP